MFNQNELETELSDSKQRIQSPPEYNSSLHSAEMVKFKLGQIAESIAEFDTAKKLDSGIIPYLWQLGLSYYYAAWLAPGSKTV